MLLASSIEEIYSNYGAFAALKNDGSVVTWGYGPYGGSSGSVESSLAGGVKSIVSTFYAFAAIKENSTVVTWGSASAGGNSSSVAGNLTSVKSITASFDAFAALREDGSVVTWGNNSNGGDSSAVKNQLIGVNKIVSGRSGAFAALKNDGTVVTWGLTEGGGDSAGVQSLLTNVVDIRSNGGAFAALRQDGSIVTWGNTTFGGSVVGDEIRFDSDVIGISNIQTQSDRILVNAAPTDLSITASLFNENIAAGSAVGTLSSTDANAGDTFTYSLVSGTGDPDNAAFTIDGAQLKINASPDYETKSFYSIRLRTTDSGGLTLEKEVILNVIDVEEHITEIRGNSLYTIVNGSSWTQAEAHSVKLGGHLLTINDAEENAFLLTGSERAIKALGGDGFYWLGMQDSDENGVYAWSSEQPADFTSWFDGEPSGEDVYGPENYGFTINFLDGDQSEWKNGYWYDTTLDGNGQIPRGIAEIPFIRRGDSAYVIVQGPTWEEAEANAVALGGHLVTINDAEENAWLVSEYIDRYHSDFFIGLSDDEIEGAWKLTDGEEYSYSNWYTGEPSNSDGGEDYVVISGSSIDADRYGYWNDTKGLTPESGIAEIKLAPNNTPTGTPSISGDPKVGSTLTIDSSAIQDADNFTGYTPTYKYIWEVSNNPGLTQVMPTWEALNTADATDGNENLEITGDLAGKLIRGVISYMDGHGTYEAVQTESSVVNLNPDYSNDPMNPAPIPWTGKVSPYLGLITNSVGDTDSADYITFTVLPGQKLTGITLTAYNSTDSKAFIGIQRGARVTASSSNPEPLLGYTHFGSGQADAVVGTNLISKLGGVLSEGTYSIWIQQLGANTDYSFDLQLEDNPTIFEPNSVILPTTITGTKVTIADTSSPEVVATSKGSPDLIEIKVPVTATINALTTERYGVGLVARNVGTTINAGTGQNIPLRGLGKYSFVAKAIPEATTTIHLEPTEDTAFFLHDAYSAFYEGLTLTADSTGRQSHQRVLNVDSIVMGSGGGTSIVDLTSKDYVMGAVTVYGADKGRSIFWGTDHDDTFISGGDSVIFGGAGSNSASLGGGRDTLQYCAGVGAVDRIEGFDRTKDVVELWVGKDMVTIEPQFSYFNGSTQMSWGGNAIEFVSVPDLTLSNLQVISRIA